MKVSLHGRRGGHLDVRVGLQGEGGREVVNEHAMVREITVKLLPLRSLSIDRQPHNRCLYIDAASPTVQQQQRG